MPFALLLSTPAGLIVIAAVVVSPPVLSVAMSVLVLMHAEIGVFSSTLGNGR